MSQNANIIQIFFLVLGLPLLQRLKLLREREQAQASAADSSKLAPTEEMPVFKIAFHLLKYYYAIEELFSSITSNSFSLIFFSNQ